ncbi:cytochrome b/b6 domain-containing protein [Shewanella sp. FJAT-51649]|uniref:cytochrome b/b6 domain-containing protein n=1 Tax=Shewanella sp. FJAT-51649 TaxID=2864210 RepID=UPI001C656077|nr:cytochrome b/b6 domain-containing protein [Shewanella sp. FJAT-51649]QYJ69899.1 cytochrome b/b6 domain-containing protein [Shewanella sp. FJAT-51649]
MSNPQPNSIEMQSYRVWDRPTRLFHWINLILVLALIIVGGMMMFRSDLGITELSGKIGLKTMHVIIGYGFAINLLIRLVWGFVGNKYARFSHMFPNTNSKSELQSYKAELAAGKNPQYLGHNPKGKFAVLAIMLLLVTIMITGLIRAGTDIYYPPLGSTVQSYLAAADVEPNSLKPYDATGVDTDKANAIKPMKGLAGEVHVYAVYLLMLLIVLHVFAVIYTEVKRQPGIISAMFSGKKLIQGQPKDE